MISRLAVYVLTLSALACGSAPDRSVPPRCNDAVKAMARLCGKTTTNEDAAWQQLKHTGCTSYESYTPNSEKQYAAFDKAVGWADCILGSATTSCEAAEACPDWND